jgi:hypothetical protein
MLPKEEILHSDCIFESHYLALAVSEDIGLELDVVKSLAEFNVCQESFVL